MQVPSEVTIPSVTARRHFPAAVFALAAGTFVFCVGATLLLIVWATPELGAMLRIPVLAVVALVVIGGAAVLAGLGGLLVGWGTPSGRPLPLGSHRSIILGTLTPIVFAVVTTLPFIGLAARGHDAGGATIVLMAAFSVALYGGMLLVVYVQGVRTGLLGPESLGLKAAAVQRGLIWGVAGSGATLIAGAFYERLLHALGLPQPQLDALTWLRGMPVSAYVIVGLGGAVVAPIVEELFFRGYIFNAYLSEKGLSTAYVGSALIFSVLHGMPTLIPVFIIMGLILAHVYRRAGTIMASVMAHMLNNALAFVSLFATLQAGS